MQRIMRGNMISTTLVRSAPVPAIAHLRRPLRGLLPMLILAMLYHGNGDITAYAHEAGMNEESSAGTDPLAPQSSSGVEPGEDGGRTGDLGTERRLPAEEALEPVEAGSVEDSAFQPADASREPDGPSSPLADSADDVSDDAGDVPGAAPAGADAPQAADAGSAPDPDSTTSAGEDPAAERDDSEAAESGDEAEETGDEEAGGAVVQVLESSQERVSRTVINLSRAMDRMLGAREVYPDEFYDSILRVRFIQRLDDSGGSRLEPRVSGRLSLPGAEERWSVIFFSDDYDDPVDRERGTDRELDEQTRGSIAVRYLRPLRDNAKTSFSVGLRTGPPDAILRGRLWYDFTVRKLAIRPEQTLFWYDERGLGASTWLRLEYPLSGLKLLRSESGATWFRRDDQFYYDQVFSLLQPISKRRGLLWQIGMQAESEPNAHVTNYYAQVRFRNLIHRDWLVFEIRPQLIRERDNDFHLERRIYVGFELLFGDPFRLR